MTVRRKSIYELEITALKEEAMTKVGIVSLLSHS
jgi:hypothetical protein